MKKIFKATKNKKVTFSCGNTRYSEQTFGIGIGRIQQDIGNYIDKDYLLIGIVLFWIWFNLKIMLPNFMQREEEE